MCELGHALASMDGYRPYQHICVLKTPAVEGIAPDRGWATDHDLLLWFRPRDGALARRNFERAARLVGTTTTWSKLRECRQLLEAVLRVHRLPHELGIA